VTFGTPTAKGLPFKATIAKVDEPGVVKDRTDEAWHSVKTGLIKGVSIGFLPDEYSYKDDGGVHFTKASVHELSLTAIPCNPEAMITAFKSLADFEVAPATPETPEGNTEGEAAHASVDAAQLEQAKAAPRATLKPFFYPSY
jgi:phage head maturation protease